MFLFNTILPTGCTRAQTFHVNIRRFSSNSKLEFDVNLKTASSDYLAQKAEIRSSLGESDTNQAQSEKSYLQREHVFRPNLSVIQRIEVKLILICWVHGLNHELPLREVSSSDRVIEILGGMAVIGTSHHDCFLLQQILYTTGRLPVELHVGLLSSLGDQLEGMNTESFHVTVVRWNTNVVKHESEHVTGLRDVGEEVHNTPWLLDVRLGVWLQGVNHVRELDTIADEENWNVVADHIKVSLPSVKFDSEPTRVTQGLRAASLVNHSREANNHRGLHTRCPQEIGTREVRDIMCHFEETLRTGTTRMHDALWDTLPVELGQLLHQVVVLQKHRAPGTNRERVVVVPYRRSLICGPEWSVVLAGWPILHPSPSIISDQYKAIIHEAVPIK